MGGEGYECMMVKPVYSKVKLFWVYFHIEQALFML